MVLPLLGSVIGGALATGGTLAMSPLLASAIGSGIGAFAETGDVEDALTAGATGYIGGSLLGNIASSSGGIGSMFGQQAGQATGQAASQATGQAAAQAGANAAGQTGLMGLNQFAPTTSLRPQMRPENLGTGAPSGFSVNDMLTGPGIMTGVVAEAAMPQDDLVREKKEYPEQSGPGRSLTQAPYSPSGSEFDYQVQPNYGLADGGVASLAGGNEREITSAAIAAIQGQHPRPEIALAKFVQVFGEQALMDLVDAVSSGQFQDTARRGEGIINGMGGAREDAVPAQVNGQTDVMLSDGEFIVPRDVVTGMGNGDPEEGQNALYGLLDRVRAGERGMMPA